METQPEPTLVEFIRYNNWANQQLLAVCASLNESQLLAKVTGAYGSINGWLGLSVGAPGPVQGKQRRGRRRLTPGELEGRTVHKTARLFLLPVYWFDPR